MKNYQIKSDSNNSRDKNIVLITNKDENPIIKSIECEVYHGVANRILKCLCVRFYNETTEIKSMFEMVPNAYKDLVNCEWLVNQTDCENIIKFFEIIQKIDPLPISAINEIMDLIDFDLSKFSKADLIQKNLDQANHQEALQLALEETKNGDQEILQKVANFYQEKNDIGNYINVLSHYPSSHPFFINANNLIHEYLLTLNPLNKDQKITLLEKKLRAVLNAEDTKLATHYFNELCSADGINVTIDNVKGDPDTLIKIAHHQRSLNEKIKRLEACIAENEKRVDATMIESNKQTQSYSFF